MSQRLSQSNRMTATDIHDVVPMDFGRYVMYTYEEGDNPAEFFLPFIWEVGVCSMSSEFFWRKEKISLYDATCS